MSPTQFKLVQTGPGALTRRVTFAERPTWFSLATRIESLFRIPIQDVGVSYIDSDGDEITLSTHEELEDYYATMLHGPNDAIKLFVKNLGAIRAQHQRQSPVPPSPVKLFDLDDDGWQPLNIPSFPGMAFFEQPSSMPPPPPPPPPPKSPSSAFVETVDSSSQEEGLRDGAASPPPIMVDKGKGREEPPSSASEVDDDASSVVSIIHSDTPVKQPVHVYEFEPDRAFSPVVGIFGPRSPRFLSPIQSRSRSLSPSLPARSRSTSRRGIIPSYRSRSKSPVFTPIYKGSRSTTPKLSSEARAPSVEVTARSRSRSPIIILPSISPSREHSPHISPLRDPVDPIPPDPPSPSLPPLPGSPTHAFEAAVPQTPSAATTSPSLSNDIAGLLNSLTNAFATHPELSEGLRNIVRNASQGAYWTAERDAIVSTAFRAAENVRGEAAQAAQAAQRAQEEAGRKVTEALGGIFRSLGNLVQPTGEAPTRQENDPERSPLVIIPPPGRMIDRSRSASPAPTPQIRPADRSRSARRAPRSPPRSPSPPHGQGSPPDYRFLPGAPRARPLPPPGHFYRHFMPPPPPPPPPFPAPPPPLEHHRPHPGRYYNPYPPISTWHTPPHGLRRSSTLPSRLGRFGPGPNFPPPVAPPPPPPVPGEYISSAARKAELEEAKRHYKAKKEEWRREKERRVLEKDRRERQRFEKMKQREKMHRPVDYSSEEEISHVPVIINTSYKGEQRWRDGEKRDSQVMKPRDTPHPVQQEDVRPPQVPPRPEQEIKLVIADGRETEKLRLLRILADMGITRGTHPQLEPLVAKYSRKGSGQTKDEDKVIESLLEELFVTPGGEASGSQRASIPGAWNT